MYASLCRFQFLSTLPVRGATHSRHRRYVFVLISIHAPREGSDGGGRHRHHLPDQISIHAPREGSDTGVTKVINQTAIFLSTLPVRGATSLFMLHTHSSLISIHAPREGSDKLMPRKTMEQVQISIHAPREGSDTCPSGNRPSSKSYFYPRSP